MTTLGKIIIGVIVAWLLFLTFSTKTVTENKKDSFVPAQQSNMPGSTAPQMSVMPLPTVEPTPETDIFKEGFMEGCLKENASYAYCSCSYNWMVKKVGKEKFIEMSMEYAEDVKNPTFEFLKLINGAVEYCL